MQTRSDKNEKRGVFDVKRISKAPSLLGKFWERFYGGGVINLRPRLRARRPLFVFGSMVVAVVVLVLGARQLLTRAEVADFFPAACLGEWDNSHLAQGEPESFGNDEDSPNETNSGIYNGTQASLSRIFCGRFVPDDFSATGEIKNVGLTLVWRVGERVEMSDPEQPQSGNGAGKTQATSTSNNEETPIIIPETTLETETITTSTEIVSPAISDEPAESTQATTSTTSFLRVVSPPNPRELKNILSFAGFGRAFAQADAAVSDIDTAIPAPPIEIKLEPVTTTTEEVAVAEQVATVAGPEIFELPPPPPPDENFLKLSYSVNGNDWFELSRINPQNWQNFTVPVSVVKWDELGNLQIRIEGIETSLAEIPKVYLDGMFVEVIYEIPAPITIISLNEDSLTQNAAKEPDSAGSPQAEKEKIKIFDEGAKHKCSIEPFSQSVKDGGSVAYSVSLRPSLENSYFELLTGDLPTGVSAVFDPGRGVGTSTPKLTLNVGDGATSASFDVVVVYREIDKNFNTTANFCQLNLIIE